MEDAAFEALRKAIDADAAERVPELLEEAREAAEARVRSILTDAYAHSLLERAQSELAGSPPTSPQGGETGLYVYGVVEAEDAEPPDDVELIGHGDLAAIARRVPLDEFGEDQLRERLNDVRWLEELARAHEAVLDDALSRMTVVPMRLCTIYSGEAQVEEMLAAEHEVFLDALARLRGRTEWGVKLIAEPGALERAAADEESGDDDAALSPGAAYMKGKSREARTREELDRIAGEWAEEVYERLARMADEALVNPVQNPEVSGHVGDMLLNGVYLVPDDDVEELSAEAAALAREFEPRGASVELTGPWPAYNFVKGSIEAAR